MKEEIVKTIKRISDEGVDSSDRFKSQLFRDKRIVENVIKITQI